MRRMILILARILARILPDFFLGALYRLLVGHQDLALCLHRVCGPRRMTDPYPASTIEEDKLNHVLKLIEKHHRSPDSRIFVTFDDGYKDATDYVERMAPIYPHLHWIIFVCPKKIEKRLGFRWDRFELARDLGRDPLLQSVRTSTVYDVGKLPQLAVGEDLSAHIIRDSDPQRESSDPSLLGMADLELFQLSSVSELRRVTQHPHVRLGNHGNSHLKFTKIKSELFEMEVTASCADMERLFGKTVDFAFPFGTPYEDYAHEHVGYLQKRGVGCIWTTYSAPYRRSEQIAGAVLPRFVIIGTWGSKEIVAFLALTSFIWRWLPRAPVTKILSLSDSA